MSEIFIGTSCDGGTRCPSWHKLKSNFQYIGTPYWWSDDIHDIVGGGLSSQLNWSDGWEGSWRRALFVFSCPWAPEGQIPCLPSAQCNACSFVEEENLSKFYVRYCCQWDFCCSPTGFPTSHSIPSPINLWPHLNISPNKKKVAMKDVALEQIQKDILVCSVHE